MTETTRFKFHTSLYTMEALTEAAAEFGQRARWTAPAMEGDYLTIACSEPDPETADTLADEFANFVLFHTISGRKQW